MRPVRPFTVREVGRAVAALVAALLLAPPAGAAVTLRKQLDLRGDFKLFGNTLAQDRATGVPAPVKGTLCTTGGSGAGQCGSATTDSGVDVFWKADPVAKTALCDLTVTAATAQTVAVLQLPAGAVVRYARLYWAGWVTSNAYDATATLTTPDGVAHAVAADTGWTASTAAVEAGHWWYQASADVTALVQAVPGSAGAYMVSGVDTAPLANLTSEVAFTGWWAVVFYEDPSEITLRNLTLFDGFEQVSSGSPASVSLSGFRVPSGGFDAKLGVVAWEGDSSFSGDQLLFKGYTSPAAAPTSLVALRDALNPANNFFNGTRSSLGAAVSVAGDLPQMTGAAGSMSGIDLDVVDLKANGAIAAGNDAAVISATSTNDAYVLGGFVTSISTYKPDFADTVKTVTNLDRTGATMAGDRLEYTITARNGGNDPSIQTMMVDALPPGITLVPGSIQIATGPSSGWKTEAAGDDQADYDAATRTLTVRLGTGASSGVGGSLAVGESSSVVFRVTVDAGAAGTIDNQASVGAAGQSGQPAAAFPSHPPSGSGSTPVVVDACLSDSQCGGSAPACDLAASPHACVACTADAWCSGATPICDLASRACVGRTGVTPASQEKPAAVGLAVPFDLQVQSHLSAAERYDLDVLDGGCASAVQLLDAGGAVLATRAAGGAWAIAAGYDVDGDGRPDLGAAAGGSVAFALRLTQAAGATGDRCLAQVVATGFTTGAAAPASVTVRAAPLVSFTPDRTGGGALTVGSGGSVNFSGVVQNNGATTASFALATTLSSSPGAGALAGVQIWSDPNGDGDPSDGVLITDTGPLAPFGGSVPVVVGVKATTAGGAPLAAGTLLSTQATATAGSATATQASQAWVGWLVSAADAAFTSSTQVFAPCATVHLRSQRLPTADSYALEWYAGSSPARGTDVPLRVVDPWPVIGGTAADSLVLAADAPDALTVLLVQRIGATTTVLDRLALGVERGGTVTALEVAPRLTLGDALTATARFRSGAQQVTHRATRVGWTVTGAGQALDGLGGFVAPPATARLRAGLDAAPAANVVDMLSVTPAWPAPGRYHVAAAWQLSCGAVPALAEGGADVDVAPLAPIITSPAAGALLNAAPTIAGAAHPGASVVVTIDGASLPPVTADAAGHFSLDLPAGTPLAEGGHLLVAVQTAAGLASDPTAPLAFTTDTLPPALQLASPAPGVLLSAAAAPLGQVDFAGTAEAGAAVALVIDGSPVAVVRSAGGFSAAVALADGAHLATVTATDAAGNQAVVAAAFDLDATPPAAPQLAAPTAGQLLGSAQAPAGLVTLSGTAEAGATVTVTVGGASTTASAVGGSFGASLLLADGDHQALLAATDAAGNGSAATTTSFRLDTVAPPAPAILAPAAGARLLPGTARVAGTAEPGSAVRISVGILSATVTAAGDGAFGADFVLAAGALTATAAATDAAGNGSPQARVDFVVAADPVTPPVTPPAPAAAGGCGCSQGSGAAGGLSLMLLGLAACWPTRRRRPR